MAVYTAMFRPVYTAMYTAVFMDMAVNTGCKHGSVRGPCAHVQGSVNGRAHVYTLIPMYIAVLTASVWAVYDWCTRPYIRAVNVAVYG